MVSGTLPAILAPSPYPSHPCPLLPFLPMVRWALSISRTSPRGQEGRPMCSEPGFGPRGKRWP